MLKAFTFPIAALVFLFALVTIYFSFYEVGPGNVGVLTHFGQIQKNEILGPGLHFVTPYYSKVKIISTRINNYSDQEVSASKDLQKVYTTVSVNWFIPANDATWVYQNVGDEHALLINVLAPVVANATKAVTAKYNAQNLVKERELVREGIEKMIIRNLQPYHLKVVSNVNITNFKFSKLFGQAIEEKQVAEQTARKRRYLLQGAVIKAKQTIVTAKAEAKAMKLKELSVTPTLVQWEAVQKWDGKLPNITGGNIPFIMSLPKHYVNGKPN